jgi:hypothetical protein
MFLFLSQGWETTTLNQRSSLETKNSPVILSDRSEAMGVEEPAFAFSE